MTTGKISRNFCLQNYISRLGAIIYILKKDGVITKGAYEEYPGGKDFVYRLDKEQTPPDPMYQANREDKVVCGEGGCGFYMESTLSSNVLRCPKGHLKTINL